MAAGATIRDHQVMVDKPSASRPGDIPRATSLAEDRPAAQPTVADRPYDRVDESGDASFPASDPPSWWSGR